MREDAVMRKPMKLIKFLGPAFMISVAYIDPGNFATNISGGSRFGYALLWVILWSNLIAIFLQTMSAKLGIATGKSLPEMCALAFGKKLNIFFWLVAEGGAMATDLAEFLGGALGFSLLFNLPMWVSCLLTGAATLLICHMERYGQKAVELVVVLLVGVIGCSYVAEIFLAAPDWPQTVFHTLVPELPGGEAIFIAVGMLGATVMPHVIYLHSQLVQCRGKDLTDEEKTRHLKLEKIDIAIAMNIALVISVKSP